MKIFPAIDISNKNVVRLTKGDYGTVKVYGTDPLAVAKEFQKAGASYLHMVDLDGAKLGTLENLSVIKNVAGNTELFIEVGGGIRDEERINAYLEAGVGRVILGTVAVKNFQFTCEMIKKYGPGVAVGVDALDGDVKVSGWLEGSKISSVDFCKKLRDNGLDSVIYTDISKDGMLSGCNLELYRELTSIEGLRIVASGGVTSKEEIVELKKMGCDGAIIGKALYEGRITLEEALAAGKAED